MQDLVLREELDLPVRLGGNRQPCRFEYKVEIGSLT